MYYSIIMLQLNCPHFQTQIDSRWVGCPPPRPRKALERFRGGKSAETPGTPTADLWSFAGKFFVDGCLPSGKLT